MDLAGVRDIAVVVLAAVSLVTTLVLLITGLLIWRLLAAVRADVSPIIGAVRDTVETVRATADAVQGAVESTAASSSRTSRVLRRLIGFVRGRLF